MTKLLGLAVLGLSLLVASCNGGVDGNNINGLSAPSDQQDPSANGANNQTPPNSPPSNNPPPTGGTGTPNDPYLISTPQGFQNIKNDLSASYKLVADIDMAGFNFVPMGGQYIYFYGTLDGNGHTVRNLTINLPSSDYVAIFKGNAGHIMSLNLANVNITGHSYVAPLAAQSINGDVTDVHVTGNVKAMLNGGGVVGLQTWQSTISHSSFVGNITGTYYNYYSNQGPVYGANIGGIVGSSNGAVYTSYVQGNILGSQNTGGVVGYLGTTSYGKVINCYMRGSVESDYASGAGSAYGVGGIIGAIEGPITVANNYAVISQIFLGVYPAFYTGTIVGRTVDFTIKTAFGNHQDRDVSHMWGGGSDYDNSTAIMKTGPSSYPGWDTASIWLIVPGAYPTLR